MLLSLNKIQDQRHDEFGKFFGDCVIASEGNDFNISRAVFAYLEKYKEDELWTAYTSRFGYCFPIINGIKEKIEINVSDVIRYPDTVFVFNKLNNTIYLKNELKMLIHF